MKEMTTACPYCSRQTAFNLPENYAPKYSKCRACGEKFIVERLKLGFEVFTRENAPCCSDPDCIALETGGSDEQ